MNQVETLSEYYKRTFSNENNIAFATYFQGIRWTMPEANETLSKVNFEIIKYGINFQDSRICHLRLVFDIGNVDEIIEDLNLVPDPTIIKVPIKYNETEYKIKVQEQTIKMGILKGFEVI